MLSPVRGNSWAVSGTKWDRCKWVWTVQLFTTVSALTLSCIITFIIHTVTAFYFLPTFLLNGIYIICKNPHQEVQCYSTVYFSITVHFQHYFISVSGVWHSGSTAILYKVSPPSTSSAHLAPCTVATMSLTVPRAALDVRDCLLQSHFQWPWSVLSGCCAICSPVGPFTMLCVGFF